MTLSTAAWIALAFVGLVHVLTTKATVRVFGRGADNGWDNAFGYALASAGLLIPLGWVITALGHWGWLLAPPLLWIGQVIALRAIYEVKGLHAVLIGATQAVIASAITGASALAAGFVAAYVLYGKIISDPMILVRLLLRLIGIEL